MTPWIRTPMLALLAATITLTAAADESTAPVPDAIRKAIQNLGSPRFAVREQASKILWDAGAAAEPLLREAANSADAEVAKRAGEILDKFSQGIYPDTPQAVVDAIGKFKAATDSAMRNAAATELLKAGKRGCLALRHLLPRIENVPERDQLFAALTQAARNAVPALIVLGDRSGAADMLEIGLLGNVDGAFSDFAVFHFLDGKLDDTIARFERERMTAKNEELRRAGKVLAHLYRIKGDFANARKSAELSEEPALVDSVLWEASDWKGLAELGYLQPKFNSNDEGLRLAYQRLAGNKAKYDELVEELKKSADSLGEDHGSFQQAIVALLLNGHGEDAMTLLRDKHLSLAMQFDLLCARLRHKEALALVNDARGRGADAEERNQIELRRARMLYLLGDRESAAQLFTRLAGAAGQDPDQIRDLLRVEVRLGVRDQACDHAAAYIDALIKREEDADLAHVFDPLFDDRKGAAETLWRELRVRSPNELPAATMKKVADLLNGKSGKDFAELAGAIEAGTARPDAERYVALAEAYAAHQKPTEAEKWFRKAAVGEPVRAQAWVRLGDLAAARKDYREAAERYELAWQADKTAPLPLFLRGLALVQQGDEREGKKLVEIAHWLPLGNEMLRCQLSEALAKRGFKDAARREADLVLQTGWFQTYQVGNLLNQAARWAVNAKDFTKAAQLYDRGVVGLMRTGAYFVESSAYLTVPQAARVYHARALIAEGKMDAALPIIEDSLKVLPGNIDLAMAVVPALEKLGKKAEADRIYKVVADAYAKATADFPESAWAHNSAAWLAANCGRDFDKALAHAEKAVKLEPKSASHLDTLAEVHFRKGDKAKALELMRKCLELDGRNPYYRAQITRFEKGDIDSPLPDENED